MLGVFLMRLLFFAMIFSLSLSCANAASSIPPDLAGIWATEGSELRGGALMKGQALYLDIDGIGASVGGDGKTMIGVRVVVTSYTPSTNALNFDFTENGKVIASGAMTYDPTQKVLFSPKDSKQRYQRRFDGLSAEMRKSLGLEVKAK
jgi:hypothetical protein